MPQPRPYQPQVEEPIERRKGINPPEFYARQGGNDVRTAKMIDYTIIDDEEE